MCHPDHPFAHQTVSLEDLIDEHLLLRENGAGMLDTLSNFLKKNHLTYDSLSIALLSVISIWRKI